MSAFRRIRLSTKAAFLLAVAGGVCLVTSSFLIGTRQGRRTASPTLVNAARSGVLLLTVGSEPSTLDPQLLRGIPERKIVDALFEGLVTYHPTDSTKAQPGVAESWEHNADFSVWTFHLRHNARWSNGDPVTAEDFRFGIRRALSPALGAPFVDYLFILDGARDYYAGKVKDFESVGVHAPDPYTLIYRFVGPTAYLLANLTQSVWMPLHRATILRFGKMDARESKWTEPGKIVGNGPFQLRRWRPNDVIEVERSPTYWDRASVRLNGMRFFAIEDLNTADRAFRAGQLHLTLEVPLDRVPVYRRTRDPALRLQPYLGLYYYECNTTRKPLDNPRVRQALACAVDREALVQNVLRAEQRPATGVTPPGMEGYDVRTGVTFDPARARRLLAEAGFPGGRGFPKLRLLINTSEAHRTVAEAIQGMWREELNVAIAVENQEWKVYLDSLHRKNYDIARAGWIGYADPVAFLGVWATGSGNNDTGWNDARYDALLDGAAHQGDPAARLATLTQAEDLFLSQVPVLPIYWYSRVYLARPEVRGWTALNTDFHAYKDVSLETAETFP